MCNVKSYLKNSLKLWRLIRENSHFDGLRIEIFNVLNLTLVDTLQITGSRQSERVTGVKSIDFSIRRC